MDGFASSAGNQGTMTVKPVSTEDARISLEESLRDLCHEFNTGVFTPILEADVAGYLYHRLLTNGYAPNTVYLATRVCGEGARTRKPDLVIGSLHFNDACVRPSLICELKAFQRWGLSDQQMRRRFEGLLAEDIPTLQEMAAVLPNGRIEIVADFYVSSQRRGYLTGKWHGNTRIDLVATACDQIGASLVWIRSIDDDGTIAYEVVV